MKSENVLENQQTMNLKKNKQPMNYKSKLLERFHNSLPHLISESSVKSPSLPDHHLPSTFQRSKTHLSRHSSIPNYTYMLRSLKNINEIKNKKLNVKSLTTAVAGTTRKLNIPKSIASKHLAKININKRKHRQLTEEQSKNQFLKEKIKNLKESIVELMIENSALCDETTSIEKNIVSVQTERNMIINHLANHDINLIKKLNGELKDMRSKINTQRKIEVLRILKMYQHEKINSTFKIKIDTRKYVKERITKRNERGKNIYKLKTEPNDLLTKVNNTYGSASASGSKKYLKKWLMDTGMTLNCPINKCSINVQNQNKTKKGNTCQNVHANNEIIHDTMVQNEVPYRLKNSIYNDGEKKTIYKKMNENIFNDIQIENNHINDIKLNLNRMKLDDQLFIEKTNTVKPILMAITAATSSPTVITTSPAIITSSSSVITKLPSIIHNKTEMFNSNNNIYFNEIELNTIPERNNIAVNGNNMNLENSIDDSNHQITDELDDDEDIIEEIRSPSIGTITITNELNTENNATTNYDLEDNENFLIKNAFSKTTDELIDDCIIMDDGEDDEEDTIFQTIEISPDDDLDRFIEEQQCEDVKFGQFGQNGMVEYIENEITINPVDNNDIFEVVDHNLQTITVDIDGKPIYPIVMGNLQIHRLGNIIYNQSGYNTENWIYPVGYTATRVYADYRDPERKCVYTCKIVENSCGPQFELIPDGDESYAIKGPSADLCHAALLQFISNKCDVYNIMDSPPQGEWFFGLGHPIVMNLIQTLPEFMLLQTFETFKIDDGSCMDKDNDPTLNFDALRKFIEVSLYNCLPEIKEEPPDDLFAQYYTNNNNN